MCLFEIFKTNRQTDDVENWLNVVEFRLSKVLRLFVPRRRDKENVSLIL